jgi:hypothetical protein
LLGSTVHSFAQGVPIGVFFRIAIIEILGNQGVHNTQITTIAKQFDLSKKTKVLASWVKSLKPVTFNEPPVDAFKTLNPTAGMIMIFC